MRRLALASIVISFLTACVPSAQSPVANPTPTDLTGRFVEVPNNQPFRYSVVAAGVIQLGGTLGTVLNQGTVGPAYNNLRVLGTVNSGRFVVTYDGYAQPDNNSNLIVKALAKNGNQNRGPYVVFFVGFNSAGIELGVHDLRNNHPPNNFDAVKVMVEISRYART